MSSGNNPGQALQGRHRVACDECSQRKVRCTSDGPGACHNCILWGEPCTYSPKIPVGRPRKRRPEKDQAEHRKSTLKTSPHPQPIVPKEPGRHNPGPHKELDLVNVATPSTSSLSSLFDLVTPVSESSVQVRNSDVGDLLLDQQRDSGGDGGVNDFNSCMLVDEDIEMSSSKPIQQPLLARGNNCRKGKPRTSESATLRSSRDTFARRSVSQNELLFQAPTSPPRSISSISASNFDPARPPEVMTMSSWPILPGRRGGSGRGGILTFTTLLNTVVCLRSRYDRLVAAVGSLSSSPGTSSSASSCSSNSINAVADDVVVSTSSFYDEVEPYLDSLLDTNSSGSHHDALLYDGGLHEIQTMICLIMTASSTVLDATRALHHLHQMVLARNDDSHKVSSRLKHMLRLSPVRFQVLRCQQSLGLVMGILSRAEKMGRAMTMISVEGITRAAREAVGVQQRVEEEIDKLKVPPDIKTYGRVKLRINPLPQ